MLVSSLKSMKTHEGKAEAGGYDPLCCVRDKADSIEFPFNETSHEESWVIHLKNIHMFQN